MADGRGPISGTGRLNLSKMRRINLAETDHVEITSPWLFNLSLEFPCLLACFHILQFSAAKIWKVLFYCPKGCGISAS
jgi:hypothetical protein